MACWQNEARRTPWTSEVHALINAVRYWDWCFDVRREACIDLLVPCSSLG